MRIDPEIVMSKKVRTYGPGLAYPLHLTKIGPIWAIEHDIIEEVRVAYYEGLEEATELFNRIESHDDWLDQIGY